MKKNSFMKLFGIIVPVCIAAFGELSDIIEERKNEAKMEDLENRLALLEKKDSE